MLEFENAKPPEILALSREKTVFLLPVAPLQDYGAHLPMGLGIAQARELAKGIGERLERELAGWSVVLFPSAPLGVDAAASYLAINVRGHVLRDWLIDACSGLHRLGFRRFIAVSGELGPQQLTAIEEAGRMLRRRIHPNWIFKLARWNTPSPLLISASSAIPGPPDIRRSLIFPNFLEHGGALDTSIALALDPARVSRDYLTLPARSLDLGSFERWWLHRRKKIIGYWGQPAAATELDGKTYFSKPPSASPLNSSPFWRVAKTCGEISGLGIR